LMNDVRAVDWLPLEAALARLSRPSEQAFLEHVGPQALAAFARQPKAKATVSRKRRSRPVLMSEPSLAGPVPEVTFAGPRPDVPLLGAISTPMQLEVPSESAAVAERPVPSDDNVGEAKEISFVAELESMATPAEFCRPTPVVPQDGGDDASVAAERRGRSLAQKVRDWLGRAA
jgi:8-oxo-dGTP diphosphatase